MTFRSIFLNEAAPVSELIQKFCEPVNQAAEIDQQAVEVSLWKAWNELIETARDTPHSHQTRLVDFLNELRRQQGLVRKDGEHVSIWGNVFAWHDLPLLGASLRNKFNEKPEDMEQDMHAQDRWINLNAFMARLLTSSEQPTDALDLSLFGIWTLREGLEDPSPDEVPLRASILATVVWLLYAAPALFQKSKEGQSYDGKAAREGKSLQGKSWRGASKERWNLWLERLVIQEERCEDDELRKLLKAAIEMMKQAEKS